MSTSKILKGGGMKESNKVKFTQRLGGDSSVSDGQEISFYIHEYSSSIARFFLDEDIREGRYYRPMVQHLLTARKSDMVEICINSGGGSLEGCSQIVEAIKISSADVSCNITGSCHSAASIIALNCNDIIVTDSAEMLVHCASYGSARLKQSDIKGFVDFSTKQLDKLIESTYEGFLSQSEVIDVQNGRELWLNSNDIRERLQKRNAYFKNKDRQVKAQQAALSKTNTKTTKTKG